MYEYSVVKALVDLPRSNYFCGFVGVGAIADWQVLDILGGSPKLSHTVYLVAIGYEAHLSSLRSVSFRFACLNFTQQVLSIILE